MIINIDQTQLTIFIVTGAFAGGIKIARDEFNNWKNKKEHNELKTCIKKIMDHFGLTEELVEKK